MTDVTALDLDAIEERASKATPGPWKVWAMDVMADPVGNSNLDDGLLIAPTYDPHRGLRTFNADFIAAARQDVPALVAEVRRLRSVVTAHVVSFEPAGAPTRAVCSKCGLVACDTESVRRITDIATRHAFMYSGALEAAGLPPVERAS